MQTHKHMLWVCAHRQNLVGVSYVFAQMMYFMLNASFPSLGDTATLFPSLSHVPPVPPGDIMTRDRWHKKIHLASFFFFPSAPFWSPYILISNMCGPYMHWTVIIIAHFKGRSLFRCRGPIIFPWTPLYCCIIFCMCHEVSRSGCSSILGIYISLIKCCLLNLNLSLKC